MAQHMELIITPEVKKLGINVCMALVREVNISNKSNPLEKRKKEVVEKVQGADIAADPILQAYHELYRVAGVEGEGFVPPAEHLLGLIKRNGRLPNINTVVDSYNLVSAETSLSIGAHDLAHLKGNVSFRITDGSEKYIPLGESKSVQRNQNHQRNQSPYRLRAGQPQHRICLPAQRPPKSLRTHHRHLRRYLPDYS